MKKVLRTVAGLLVFAMGMGLCSCGKTQETVVTSSDAVESESVVSDSVVSSENNVETTEDPWLGSPDVTGIVGASWKASQFLGRNIDDVLYDHELNALWNSTSSMCAFNQDERRQVLVPEDGYEISGYKFDQIYLWKDNAGNVNKITFMTRHNEYLPETAAETVGAADDLNYDVQSAMGKMVIELSEGLGDYYNENVAYLNAKDGASFVFEHNGIEIVLTYGVDCYGLAGNNELKIDVYAKGTTFPAYPEEDFKVLITKLSYCMGEDYESARDMVEDALGVELTNEQIDYYGYIYYSVDATVEGVDFNQVIIITNEGDGKVYEVHLVNDMDSEAEIEGYYNLFKDKLRTVCGDYFIPWNHQVYDGCMIRLDSDNDICMIGRYTIEGYSRFHLIMNNEALKEDK